LGQKASDSAVDTQASTFQTVTDVTRDEVTEDQGQGAGDMVEWECDLSHCVGEPEVWLRESAKLPD
jgi:hypothetical protein